MIISYSQHHDWFIASLLPHLIIPLCQQKIATRAEALEITMWLEASPIQDMNLGVQQIHSKLESLHLELQSLKKGKETQPKVCTKFWCLKCKSHGHDKDHCSVFKNYIIGGRHVPMKLENNVGMYVEATIWCTIHQVTG